MTVEANIGAVAILEATFLDQPGGSATDPSSVQVEVLDQASNVDFGPYTYPTGITKVAVGFYRKELAIPAGTDAGTYTIKWTAVISGSTQIGYETLILTALTPTTGSTDERIWYCNRDDVKSALDFKSTARNNAQIDRAIESASRAIEGITRRKFYPQYAIRTFDWPNFDHSDPWRLWLRDNEVIEIVSLVSGADTISSDDYFLEPNDTGPPYTSIEIDLSSGSMFAPSDTHQRAISITGTFGYNADVQTIATLTEALDASETGIDVSDSSVVGVGDIIQIDSERMTVTNKTQIDTGQNLGTSMTAQNSNQTVAVSDGTQFHIGEVITIETERMLVTDIVGNNLFVLRAWDGTTIAAHTSPQDIYAPRTLDVKRGALGTTAATHSTSTTVYKHVVPGLVKALCVAEAINTVLQESSGYARAIGSGEGQAEMSGRGLKDLRDQVKARYGRQARVRSI